MGVFIPCEKVSIYGAHFHPQLVTTFLNVLASNLAGFQLGLSMEATGHSGKKKKFLIKQVWIHILVLQLASVISGKFLNFSEFQFPHL